MVLSDRIIQAQKYKKTGTKVLFDEQETYHITAIKTKTQQIDKTHETLFNNATNSNLLSKSISRYQASRRKLQCRHPIIRI